MVSVNLEQVECARSVYQLYAIVGTTPSFTRGAIAYRAPANEGECARSVYEFYACVLTPTHRKKIRENKFVAEKKCREKKCQAAKATGDEGAGKGPEAEAAMASSMSKSVMSVSITMCNPGFTSANPCQVQVHVCMGQLSMREVR